MNLVITLAAILVASYVLVLLGKKIKVPGVVTFIIVGLIFDISIIKSYLIKPHIDFILILGDIGLFCLMFLAGLETSWRLLYKEKRNAAFIAVFAALLPFFLGLIILSLLGFSFLTAATVGLCMSITAEATKARVLLELKKLKTKLGAVMMGAGIIDDLIGLLLFLLITLSLRVYSIESFIALGVIVSFFGGIIFHRKIGRTSKIVRTTEKLLLFLIVPFFFISIGIHFDFNSLVLNPFLLFLLIVVAIVGKLAGTLLTKPLTKLDWKQLYLIGWAMNSRGAIELALAILAFKMGLLTIELYSGLIIVALVTTLIFPFIITNFIKKNPKIMDR